MKSCHGDGFQRWHQDLNNNGQTVGTIIVNIESLPKDDIANIVANILKNQDSLGAREESNEQLLTTDAEQTVHHNFGDGDAVNVPRLTTEGDTSNVGVVVGGGIDDNEPHLNTEANQDILNMLGKALSSMRQHKGRR